MLHFIRHEKVIDKRTDYKYIMVITAFYLWLECGTYL